MDHVDRYVAHSNVCRFLDQLEREPDGSMRSVLQRLLLAEEDRFAKHSERLAMAETAYAMCQQRVREQRSRIANIGEDDPRMASAKRLLANMVDSLWIVQTQRDRLKSGFE